jgi:hypothetical protein
MDGYSAVYLFQCLPFTSPFIILQFCDSAVRLPPFRFDTWKHAVLKWR